MRVPNLAENCVPESGVPSDRCVPNLAANPEPEPSAAALLETFAAVTRRRASEATSSNADNSRNAANTLNIGIFGRGLATNLVRLAVSSNFPSELLNKNKVCREPLQLLTILRDQIEFIVSDC